MNKIIVALGIILFLGLGIIQLMLGFAGIDHHLGSFWAWIALIIALVFRFPLPIIVGVFFGVKDVLEWHWLIALLIAAPGILFIIPSIVAVITAVVTNWVTKK